MLHPRLELCLRRAHEEDRYLEHSTVTLADCKFDRIILIHIH